MRDALPQFRDAIQSAGMIPPADIEPDGKLRRFSSNGKKGHDSGWYVLHGDGIPAGCFGDWRIGLTQPWRADIGRVLSPQEEAAYQTRIEAMRREREAEEIRRHEEARRQAEAIWQAAKPVSDHPYLTRKSVKSHGLRVHEGKLMVPMHDAGVIHSLQTIGPNGDKLFLPGGRVKGCYFSIGKPDGVLCIAEGYATGASIHEATGYAVTIAFNAYNLSPVAKAIRARFPDVRVIVCADDDIKTEGNPGLTKAREAALSIGGMLAIPDFGADRPDGSTDFNDLHQAQGLEAVKRCIAGAEAIAPKGSDPHAETENAPPGDVEEKQQSQAVALVQFCEQRVDLFHDDNKEVFARLKDTGEVWKIGSRAFRDWLTSGFYKTTGKSARDQSMREALGTMEGLGRYRGKLQQVFIRVGQTQTHYYLDLAESGNSRCIEISQTGWRIKESSPVAFVRFETMQALPEPVRGGDISLLWPLVNVPSDARWLVAAWLLECLRPDSPFPVLEFLGEQGSAKSSTQLILRRVLDPNSCDLRAAPKTPEDVFVAGGANWIVSYENISHLSAPMQDAYCVLATGGGFAKRKLYSDADEIVIRVKRPVVINGIAAAITAQDLIDRTLSIETPVIRDRREVSSLTQEFERDHASILGGLLDIMVKALTHLPSMQIPADDRPRLIEFAKLGMATVKAMGGDQADFLKEFNKRRDESISRTIDASPVATAVLTYMGTNPAGITDTAERIMRAMEQIRSPGYTDAWPRTPKGFADALRRAAPALRQLGTECHSLPKKGGVIQWVIQPRRNSQIPCPASPACPTNQDIKTFRTSDQPIYSGVENSVVVEII